MFQKERLAEKIALVFIVLALILILWAAISHPQWLADPEREYRGF